MGELSLEKRKAIAMANARKRRAQAGTSRQELVERMQPTEIPPIDYPTGTERLTTAASGLTIGFQDEITGAANAITGAVQGEISPEQLSYNYQTGRDTARAIHDQAYRERPGESMAIEAATGVAAAVPTGGAAAARIAPAVAAKAPGIVRWGAGGIVPGTVAGAGYSEADNPADLAMDTAQGAAIGAAGGALLYGTGKTFQAAYRFGRRPIANTIEAGRRTLNIADKTAGKAAQVVKESNLPPELKSLTPEERIIAQAIRAEGLDIDQALQLAKDARAQGFNLPIFQTLDSPTLQAYANAVESFGGGGKIARQNLQRLKEGEIPLAIHKAIKAVAGNDLSPADNGKALSQLADQIYGQAVMDMEQRARPFYEASTKAHQVLDEKVFNKLKANGPISVAIDKVKSNQVYKEEIAGASPASMKYLHIAKQELDDMIAREHTRDGKNKIRLMMDGKQKLLAAMEDAYPDYRAARDIYSEDADFVKKLENGHLGIIKNLGEDKYDKAMDKLMQLPPEHVAQIRDIFTKSGASASANRWEAGIASWLQRKFEETRDVSVLQYRKKVFGDAYTRKRLSAALGEEKFKGLSTFMDTLDEAVMAVRKVGGSRTAPCRRHSRR